MRHLVGPVLTILFLAGCLDLQTVPDEGQAALPLYQPDCTISNWADPCVVRASPNESPSKTEIDIVADPNDPDRVFVASKDNDPKASDCVWSVGQYSNDGGKSWTTTYVGGTKDERQPGEPLYGYACITDPIMAYDEDGRLYYALQAYNIGPEGDRFPDVCGTADVPGGIDPGSTFLLATSDSNGASWDRIIPIHTGEGTVVLHDYPRMAFNPTTGSVFAVWNQFNSVGLPCDPVGAPGEGNIIQVLTGTRDRGQTPIRPVYLVPADDPNFGNYDINGFAIADDGTMFVTMDVAEGNVSHVYLVTSTDDGETWSDPTLIFDYTRVTPGPGGGRSHTPTTRFRSGSSVELAADRSDGPFAGCLYGNHIDNSTGDWSVMVRRSCDKGRTWTDPVRVNKDTEAAYQFMTRPTITSDGVVHVVYQTQAYDPEQRLIDAEYAFSEDGGETWTVRRLTEIQSDGDLGVHQDGGPFFGDYNGITSSGTTVYAGFPHTLTGKAEIAVARIVRGTGQTQTPLPTMP